MRSRDWLILCVGVGFFLLMVALIAFGVWAHFAAPCSFVSTYSTVHDLPARCLTFVRTR